ncbi:hypothetical protein A9P19_004285 [Pseudomonas aeruginosa]|nr:hypothetical protein [Pseudomonas aeruginosa]HEJ3418449.1 hypothetical protein [Pseudomonas aeruginosa]HEJ9814478.1 hypothetical protein [Pseudomonas aeruginosa]HEJ9821616.1 hypothetical protein [Pseudomonas aeruginosa]
MTDHAELRRLDDSEVEQLLERYIKRFPGEHKAAMSRYFEAVHQELAPLARKLEAERDRLKAENEELRRLCSCAKQYDLSMTLRRMIDAAIEGAKQ